MLTGTAGVPAADAGRDARRDHPRGAGAARARSCPRVPVPLLWIVERCLAKLPEERYASTRDLARDLQSVRDHFSQIDSGAEGAPLLLLGRRRARPRALALGGRRAPRSRRSSPRRTCSGTSAADRAAAVVPPADVPRRDGLVGPLRARRRARSSTARRGTAARSGSTRRAPRRRSPRRWRCRPRASSPCRRRARWRSRSAPAPSGAVHDDRARSRASTLVRRRAARGARVASRPPTSPPTARASPCCASSTAGTASSFRSAGRSTRRPPGYLSDARVSPRGDLVAFLEHPMRGDDAGAVAVVDREGAQAHALVRLDHGARPRLVAGRRRGLVHGGFRRRSRAPARRLARRAPAPGGARPGSADAARRLARGPRAPRRRSTAREGMMGLSPGRGEGAGPLLARLVAPVDLTADGTTLALRRDGRGRRRRLRRVRAQDRRLARRAAGRRPRARALSRREVGAVDAPDRVRPSSCCCRPAPGSRARSRRAASPTSSRRRGFPAASTCVLAANEPGRAPRLYVQPAEGGDAAADHAGGRRARLGGLARRDRGGRGRGRTAAAGLCIASTAASPRQIRGAAGGRRADPLLARRPLALRARARRGARSSVDRRGHRSPGNASCGNGRAPRPGRRLRHSARLALGRRPVVRLHVRAAARRSYLVDGLH